jgi:hypothetical protein
LRLPSFAGAFPRRRCYVRLVGENCRRVVRAYWLARGRGSFGPWPDPGLTAAARLPLLPSVGRRPSPVARSPVPVPAGRSGLSKVRSSTGSRRHRPGRLPPGRSHRTGRLGVSLVVLAWHPFGVCRPRRAVRGLPASRTIPLRRSLRVTTPKPCPASPLRFSRLASRVRSPIVRRAPFSSRRLGTPPVRVIRAWCSSDSARSGPAPGLFSRPGRRCFRVAGDARGVCRPFAVLLRTTGECASSASLAHLPFRLPCPPREFHRRGARFLGRAGDAVGRGSWVLAPRASLRHASASPAKAFARRTEPDRGSVLPWVFLHRSGNARSDSRRFAFSGWGAGQT